MSDAFLALWNGYPSVMTEEYEAWHTFEHVPERLTVPGMMAARRYASPGKTESRYFTLYELADLHTIEHPAYADLVRNPTPWSAKMRAHFSDVLRIPARRLAFGGRGIGRCSLVQAYSVERKTAEHAGLRLAETLHEMTLSGILLSYIIGLAEPNQPYEVFAQSVRSDDTYDIVLIVDGVCRRTLEEARPSITQTAHQTLRPISSPRDDVFDLIVAYPGNAVPADRAKIAASQQLKARYHV